MSGGQREPRRGADPLLPGVRAGVLALLVLDGAMMEKPIQLKKFGSKITVPAHLEESIRQWIEADNRRFSAWMARLMDHALEDDHAPPNR